MAFEIESGIPLATDQRGSRIFPFNTMKVGDSFALPSMMATRVSTAATKYSKDHSGVKFTVRKNGDGHRCWRIA